MIRIIENGCPWNNGYALSCMKNLIVMPHKKEWELTKSGRYLYALRVNNDYSVIEKLVSDITHYRFVREFFKGSVIVPVPPSKERMVQPVEQMAFQIAGKLGITCDNRIFSEVLEDTTSPVTDKFKSRKYDHIYIPSDERLSSYDKNQRFIIFDDYYDSGKTMTSAVTVLKEAGFTNIDIFAVCVTQRAKKRLLGRKPYEILKR